MFYGIPERLRSEGSLCALGSLLLLGVKIEWTNAAESPLGGWDEPLPGGDEPFSLMIEQAAMAKIAGCEVRVGH